MGNYIGYFRSIYNDYLYSVSIKHSMSASKKPQEITLAGTQPFVVTYNQSDTPFDGYRNSTAKISVVADHYFEGTLPSKAKETKVILTNETTGEIEWCGYLTPKVYDMGYTNCNEIIELEASDCISILQYLDYEPFNNKGIVNIHSVISRICSATDLLTGYYYPLTKWRTNQNNLRFTDLEISERNFFSSDMEESWTLQEVLEEICKYVGLTAMQIGEKLYFVDYNTYNKKDVCTFIHYIKMDGFENLYPQSGTKYVNSYLITEKDIMGNDNSISFEPVYNKVLVNCNMYTCDDFIPNIFDDKFLTNRNGEFYHYFEVPHETPATAEYRYGNSWGSAKYVSEETSDADNKYFHRLYDNEYWESIYRQESLHPLSEEDYRADYKTQYITKNYVGGTIVDLGVVQNKYFDKEIWQYVVANKVDYERYLCLNQMGNCLDFAQNSNGAYDNNYSANYAVYKLKSGFKSQCMVSKNAYMIINYKYIMERYRGRNYINPDWAKGACKGATGYYISGPHMWFQLKIGDKYWTGYKWVTDKYIFKVPCGTSVLDDNLFNTDMSIVNSVEWDLFANEEGYKIPLNDVDTKAAIEFKILLPEVMNRIYNKDNSTSDYWNNYCWIKDFKISVIEPGQDMEREENDIVYENIINDINISELDEIDLKITSYTPDTKPSYSNMGLVKSSTNTSDSPFLEGVKEDGLNNNDTFQKPELNIIEKYYNQYSTPTKKIQLTIGNNISPLQKVFGVDVDNPTDGYVQLGTEIDYRYDKQTITLLQKK